MASNDPADPYNLKRFVVAQAGVYGNAFAELSVGRKRGHWMWFIFPQIKGLGQSEISQQFAISCKDEAGAYLQHQVLGSRLLQCTRIVIALPGNQLERIFAWPDNLKFCSCITLFSQVDPEAAIFDEALDKYCNGVPDPQTLRLLGSLT